MDAEPNIEPDDAGAVGLPNIEELVAAGAAGLPNIEEVVVTGAPKAVV